VANCRKISELFKTSFASMAKIAPIVGGQGSSERSCENFDVSAKKSDENPGAKYRTLFKSHNLAEQLASCVRIHGSVPNRMEWTPDQHAQATATVQWLLRNVKVRQEYTAWRKRRGDLATEDGRKLEVHGAYCTTMAGRLEVMMAAFAKAEELVDRIGENESTKQSKAVATAKDEITVAVVPYIYASILAFAVVNLSIKVVELEGELNLELFSVHIPISLYVSEKPSLVEGATEGSPGMLIVAEPWVRSMSGRFFATITIFGKAFQTPAVDWTGLRLTLTSLCKGFGYLQSRCGTSTEIDNVLPVPQDPRLRPHGTGTCYPCFVNHDTSVATGIDAESGITEITNSALVGSGIDTDSFFGKGVKSFVGGVSNAVGKIKDKTSSLLGFSGEFQNTIVCPATPKRAVQFAGFMTPKEVAEKVDIFNLGASNSDQIEDGNNLGHIFFKKMADPNIRRTWSKDLIKYGYAKTPNLLDHIFNGKSYASRRPELMYTRGVTPGFVVSICDEHVVQQTTNGGYTYTGTLVMFEIRSDIDAKHAFRREGQDEDTVTKRTQNLNDMRGLYPEHEDTNPLPFYFKCSASPPSAMIEKMDIPKCSFRVSGRHLETGGLTGPGTPLFRSQKAEKKKILRMINPVIQQLQPILLPMKEQVLKEHAGWSYLRQSSKTERFTYAAEHNGGFRNAQQYSERIFFTPDESNNYQLAWNREEATWVVQRYSPCNENDQHVSNNTKTCTSKCTHHRYGKLKRFLGRVKSGVAAVYR
jgi:hypothetical protein